MKSNMASRGHKLDFLSFSVSIMQPLITKNRLRLLKIKYFNATKFELETRPSEPRTISQDQLHNVLFSEAVSSVKTVKRTKDNYYQKQ